MTIQRTSEGLIANTSTSGWSDTLISVAADGSAATISLSKTVNVGNARTGRIIRVNYTATDIEDRGAAVYFTALSMAGLSLGTSVGTNTVLGTIPNTLHDSIGLTVCYIHYTGCIGGSAPWTVASSAVNECLVVASAYVTLDGLVAGQKVELYRTSDNALLFTQTVASSSVQFDISALPFPLSLYMKIYTIDGTLLETTDPYLMYAGDTWSWSPGGGQLLVESDNFIIYRQDTDGVPKKATITAILKTPDNSPYVGKTIQFSTTIGTLSASSGVTDSNGQAKVTLTATGEFGLCVVTATWAGDAGLTAGVGFATVHIFFNVEKPRSSEGFQFFCEGVEHRFSGGNYIQYSDNVAGTFEVDLKEWSPLIIPFGLVSIYRKGVLEFSGVLTTLERKLKQPNPPLIGKDASTLLDDRVIDYESYAAQTPGYIIADLLSKYPCGITPGDLSSYTDTVTLDFLNITLTAAFQKLVVDTIGWAYRTNADRTLDIAESFGTGLTPATFTEGDNLLDAGWKMDYTLVKNSVRLQGATTDVTSEAGDANDISTIGVHETPVFSPTTKDKNTADKAANSKVGDTSGGGEKAPGTGGACFRFGTRTEGDIMRTLVHYGLFSFRRLAFSNGAVLYVTGKHLLKINDAWTPAKLIEAGDVAYTKDGRVSVESNNFGGFTWRTFNHETRDHVFYANSILVHNMKAPT
jgi:Bacterial Ig-like domain (group 1)